MTQTEKTLARWIEHARNAGMSERVKEFWMLWDYLGGGLSDAYYRKHAQEAMEALAKIDVRKGENAEAVSEIRRRVEGWL